MYRTYVRGKYIIYLVFLHDRAKRVYHELTLFVSARKIVKSVRQLTLTLNEEVFENQRMQKEVFERKA